MRDKETLHNLRVVYMRCFNASTVDIGMEINIKHSKFIAHVVAFLCEIISYFPYRKMAGKSPNNDRQMTEK